MTTDPTILYWHWLVLGLALMLVEMLLPSFIALWFGAGAMLVGIVLLVIPGLSFEVQILLWTVASILFTWLWFRFFKPFNADMTLAGLSREAIVGETGQVLSLPVEKKRGVLRFPAPILGSDEWQFICEDTIAIGDRVKVHDVSGNTLIVKKS